MLHLFGAKLEPTYWQQSSASSEAGFLGQLAWCAF